MEGILGKIAIGLILFVRNITISQKGIMGQHPHPNIAELYTLYLRLQVKIHNSSLIETSYACIMFPDVIVLHRKQSKYFQNIFDFFTIMNVIRLDWSERT